MTKSGSGDPGSFLVQMLIERGDHELAFQEAVRWGKRQLVNKFLEDGIDVNWKDPQGGTALTMAAYACEHQIVKQLLEHGADVNVIDKKNMTALHWAVGGLMPEAKSKKVAKLLLAAGADKFCQLKDKNGYTPADYAREKYSQEYVELLSSK